MKLFIYVTNISDALKGDFEWSLNASTRNDLADGTGWFLFGEVETELTIDRELFTDKAIENIDDKIQEMRAETEAKITDLNRRKQELLAITYQSE